MKAVILAGGKGTRLRPYTVGFPKPLVPVGDTPVLDIVLQQLSRAGFNDITVSTGHLAELIKAYCGDGSKWGLALDYTHEETPLHTAGALKLVQTDATEYLVMNGDVLTTLDYAALMREHVASGARATAVTTTRDFPVEFGVVRVGESGSLVGWDEKPVHTHEVSMGIYVVNSSAVDLIAEGESLGMPDLLMRIIEQGGRVATHHTDEYWLDIGRVGDYEQAQVDFEASRHWFLGPEGDTDA